MAADLDRTPGGAAGRAGFLQGPGGIPPGSWGSFAGPDGVPAGLEGDFIVFRYILIDFRYVRN